MSAGHVEAGLDRLAALAGASKALAPQVARIAARYTEVLRGGGTLFFCGNGGSAADAQHVATEYVVRYAGTRRALAAVALTTDTSLLTAAGNDLGFEQIFARQVEALCRPGDLLVLVADVDVLFAGDLCFFGVTPLAFQGNPATWADVLDVVGELAETIVPGHGLAHARPHTHEAETATGTETKPSSMPVQA